MPSRIYFHDDRGHEIDTPLSGKPYGWLGSALTTTGTDACVDHAHPVAHDALGRVTRTELQLASNGRKAGRFITIRDFPGRDRVLVKAWHSGGYSEWFWLIAGPTRVTDRERATTV